MALDARGRTAATYTVRLKADECGHYRAGDDRDDSQKGYNADKVLLLHVL